MALRLLVAEKADLHAKCSLGTTALHHAGIGNNTEAIPILLEAHGQVPYEWGPRFMVHKPCLGSTSCSPGLGIHKRLELLACRQDFGLR